jgi:hypothetical protein
MVWGVPAEVFPQNLCYKEKKAAMDSKTRNAKQAYQRSLSKGFILKPKATTLKKYGLTEFWEGVKRQNSFLSQRGESAESVQPMAAHRSSP